jgi:hypothetical protein
VITYPSVHIDLTTTSTLIGYSLIDLSNTTVWNHKETSVIILRSLGLIIEPSAAFTGEIKIGFLSAVDATNGDFNQIALWDSIVDAQNRRQDIQLPIDQNGLRCALSHHTGPAIANSTLFQTDVNLSGPDDPTTTTYPSAAGDLVMIVDGDGTNAVHISANLSYTTE